ncbi:MAG: hypothetical protein HZC47_06035 [Methanobacterium sp.]|uniref:hypothetical protein n=1 Tax=Methanobacterium sp. TaxID=2164 RepID=UPI003D65E82A|nr:hypothetical protein [Methanobacterium sp.]
MKLKTIIFTIFICILIVFSMGCTTDYQYPINDSLFNMTPLTWDLNDTSSSDTLRFEYKHDVNLTVDQFPNKDSYNSNYKAVLSQNNVSIVKIENKKIKGVDVNYILFNDTISYNTFEYYYFQKNGKYYLITVYDYTKSKYFKNKVDKTVELIISTMRNNPIYN